MELTPQMKQIVVASLRVYGDMINQFIGILEGPESVAPMTSPLANKPQGLVRVSAQKKARRWKSGAESSGPTKYQVGKSQLVRVMSGQEDMSVEDIARKLAANYSGTRFTFMAIENALKKYAINHGNGWRLAT